MGYLAGDEHVCIRCSRIHLARLEFDPPETNEGNLKKKANNQKMNTYSKHFKTYDDLKYQINNACAFRKDLTKLNIFNK